MQTIRASEFKAKCLQLMDEIASSGDELVITKNGKPVSKLVPYHQKPASLFGLHQNSVQSNDDLVEPVDIYWEAEQ